MTDAINSAQAAHWNQVAGPKWVSLGEAMEMRLQNINDLLLARAAAAAGEAVLDIGCGTGATTLPLADAVGASGAVVGIDISEPMLAVARRRVAERSYTNVSLLLADAQTHPLQPGRFDLLTSRFGLMFFADPVAAFRNLLSACRPRGRLCFVCWAALTENPHWLVPFEIVVRRLGAPLGKPAHAPGPLAFSDADYVRDILNSAGFEPVGIAREPIDIIGSTPKREALVACMMGPSGALLDEHNADDATRTAIQEEMAEAFASYASNGSMLLPASVFLVSAFRPGASATNAPDARFPR